MTGRQEYDRTKDRQRILGTRKCMIDDCGGEGGGVGGRGEGREEREDK